MTTNPITGSGTPSDPWTLRTPRADPSTRYAEMRPSIRPAWFARSEAPGSATTFVV